MTAWIALCKKIQQREKCSYKDAMKIASKEYNKTPKKGGSIKKTMIKELDTLVEKGTKEKKKSKKTLRNKKRIWNH